MNYFNYFCVGYFIIINLIAFTIMGIDKKKAKNRKWRIPERTLFLNAIIGGSIGMIFGMYFFHHKTKHLSFTLGIPIIIAIQFIVCFVIFSQYIK